MQRAMEENCLHRAEEGGGEELTILEDKSLWYS